VVPFWNEGRHIYSRIVLRTALSGFRTFTDSCYSPNAYCEFSGPLLVRSTTRTPRLFGFAAGSKQAGEKPTQVLADSGYTSDASLQEIKRAQVDAYLAVAREKHHQRTERCPRGPLPKGATRTDRMRRKLQTQVERTIYAARKAIVEPVFGQIKQARGFRQFLPRGLKKVRGSGLWSVWRTTF